MASANKSSKLIAWILLAILLALLAVKTFFVGYYRIPQNGMYPGLPAGSSIFTSKRAYSSAANVKRGDIIVFAREENGQRYIYIWRGGPAPPQQGRATA